MSNLGCINKTVYLRLASLVLLFCINYDFGIKGFFKDLTLSFLLAMPFEVKIESKDISVLLSSSTFYRTEFLLVLFSSFFFATSSSVLVLRSKLSN